MEGVGVDCVPDVLRNPVYHSLEPGSEEDSKDLRCRVLDPYDGGMARPLPYYYARSKPSPHSIRYYRGGNFRRVSRCLPALHQVLPEQVPILAGFSPINSRK